ncbi:MAG: hypothetical protein ACUVTD_02040 [Nitrososphaerales archaeon]
METWKIGVITIAIAALVGVFAISAYGYGMSWIGTVNRQYQPYNNYQQGSWGQGMMGNNWQGMMNACHSYMNQYITSQPNQV